MRHFAEGPSVKAPVCGMDVAQGHAGGGSAEHQGTTYTAYRPIQISLVEVKPKGEPLGDALSP
jgi:hypothetical protein